MDLYFDNAAAMECGEGTLTRFQVLARQYFANQEAAVSGTREAVSEAEKALLEAFCGTCRREYGALFVNTGTDAVSAGVLAAEKIRLKGDIVLTGGEHACVQAAAKRTGRRLRIAGCDRSGRIAEEHLRQAVTQDTALAALHFVQAETGAVQAPELFRQVLDEAAPDALLLIDAIQGAGKIPFDFSAVRPDFFTISGQKLGVPGGAALIFRKKYKPILRKLRFEEHRIGRLPPAFAVLLAETAAEWVKSMPERRAHAQRLKDHLLKELSARIPGKIQVTAAGSSPFILHLLLADQKTAYQGAIVTRALAERGIIAAPGSACNAETDQPSAALRWMNVPARLAYSA